MSFLSQLETLLEPLQDPTPAGQARLCFSGKFGDCYFYDVLQGSVDLLHQMVPFTWLALINYTGVGRDGYQHLNFRTAPKIGVVFEDNKDRMFLLTGMPCFQPDYLPRSKELINRVKASRLHLPPVALLVNCDSQFCEQDEVWVKIVVQRQPFTCHVVDQQDQLIAEYVQAVIQQIGPEFQAKVQTTVDLYIEAYPETPTGVADAPRLFLFLPCGYREFWYKHGLLVALDGSRISDQQITALREWAGRIFQSIDANRAEPMSPVYLPQGTDLKRYLNLYNFRSDKSDFRVLADSRSGAQGFLGCNTLPTDLHDLSDIALDEFSLGRIADRETMDYLTKIEKEFSYLIRAFTSLGLDLDRAKASVAVALFRQHSQRELGLVPLLAFAQEGGWKVTTGGLELLDLMLLRLGWPNGVQVENGNLRSDPQFILNRFVAWLTEKTSRVPEMHVVSGSSEVRWYCDCLLSTTTPHTEKRIYLDVWQDWSAHELTWAWTAARELACDEGVIMPITKGRAREQALMSLSFEDFFQRYGRPGIGGQSWLLLSDSQARIFATRSWRKG